MVCLSNEAAAVSHSTHACISRVRQKGVEGALAAVENNVSPGMGERPHAEIHIAGKLCVVCITLQIKPNEACFQAMITRTYTCTLALHLLLTQLKLGNQSDYFRDR